MRRLVAPLATLAVLLGCGAVPERLDDERARGPVCTPEDPSPGALPARLSETGLLCDGQPSGAARSFVPNWPLWTDGLEKERSLLLLDGQKILARADGSWDLPVGARLAKTILVEGAPVETRVAWRMEDGWKMGAYEWRGEDAELVANGKTLESGYQIPDAQTCLSCHGQAPSPNAFNAWQLRDAPALSVDELLAEDLLRGPGADLDIHLPGAGAVPDALGYLATNCGSCHSDHGLAAAMDLRLDRPAQARLEDTPFFQTAVGVRAQAYDATLVVPGAPDASLIYQRMVGEGGFRMPPLGTHVHDQAGIDTVAAAIRALP